MTSNNFYFTDCSSWDSVGGTERVVLDSHFGSSTQTYGSAPILFSIDAKAPTHSLTLLLIRFTVCSGIV